MKCDKCSAAAVIYQKYSGMRLCAAHFQEDANRKIRGALRESGIFAHGAKLALAIDGSANSAVLIHVLRSQFPNRRDIDLMAIMIDEGIAGYRPQALDEAVRQAFEHHVPFVVARFEDAFEVTIDELHDSVEICSICKSMKNKLLKRTAAEVGADALAAGSSLDDEAAEIMAGYLSGAIDGAFNAPDASSKNEGREIPVILPLRRIPAEEVRLYAEILGISFKTKVCPHAGGLLTDVKKELGGFESRHPGTNYSLLRSVERVGDLRHMRDEEGQSL